MPVSGKTSPDDIPFLLDGDIPDMGAGDKAIAERVQEILQEEDRQPLAWLKKGTKKQLIVCNSSGVPQYVSLGGDATIAEDGTLSIGAKKIVEGMLADDAVTPAKIAPSAVGASEVADGSLTDAELASPNNSVYRTLMKAKGMVYSQGGLGGVYLLGSATASGGRVFGSGLALTPKEASNTEVGPEIFYFDDGDYAVAGKTQKLRLRVQVAVNGTKPSSTLTFGLYPATASGSSDEIAISAGAVVTSSTVAVAEPSASTITPAATADFTIPADGAYLIGVVISPSSLTAGSVALVNAQLQHRNV